MLGFGGSIAFLAGWLLHGLWAFIGWLVVPIILILFLILGNMLGLTDQVVAWRKKRR